ncbi:formylglycine-generating enzyme family protein [Guyparkeria hydrothermalis]|uniref:formylglycine-generating enzyme family protein n=1 Tax=Guyparkeria hydrothermalis TaxID=923 RepID=UPI002020C081|nr:formylglycine-generating enzyme family protein [Guyparkeria hydrothermalis]MCL7750035.1 formylglycine-generating enzyme family protein [Guyparkeria hydrothermalis]
MQPIATASERTIEVDPVDKVIERQRETAHRLGLEVFFRDGEAGGEPAPEVAVIPSGGFWMGSRVTEHRARAFEQPRHEVYLDRAFAVTRGAIRRREYLAFLQASGHRRPRPYSWNDPEFPMYNVSARDAEAYARWLSEATGQRYRLPTEAEWEYAARAGSDTMFCFGDRIRRQEVNCAGGLHCTRGLFLCGIGKPVRVGSLPPNAWGLYEVHGNVQEFTQDHWHDAYPGGPRPGDRPYRSIDRKYRYLRAVRGGSWFDPPGACRSGSRARRHQDEFDLNLGFRLVREIEA